MKGWGAGGPTGLSFLSFRRRLERRSRSVAGPRLISLVLSIFLAGAALPWPGPAQAQVLYEKRGSGGTVFSDTPLPGGRPARVPPDNAVPAPAPPALAPLPPAAPGKDADAPRPFAYSAFAIVYPENAGSASANTAAFAVRLRIEPPLRLDLGHTVALRLDGQPVPGRYTREDLVLPPEAFGDTVALNRRYRLEASILDRDGRVLISASPVDFYLRLPPPLRQPRR